MHKVRVGAGTASKVGEYSRCANHWIGSKLLDAGVYGHSDLSLLPRRPLSLAQPGAVSAFSCFYWMVKLAVMPI
jgi:hypothetical protein